MEREHEKLQLSETEREKMLFILGAYAHTLSTEHWNELASRMEEFAVDLASRAYDSGREQGMTDAGHLPSVHRTKRRHRLAEQDA